MTLGLKGPLAYFSSLSMKVSFTGSMILSQIRSKTVSQLNGAASNIMTNPPVAIRFELSTGLGQLPKSISH